MVFLWWSIFVLGAVQCGAQVQFPDQPPSSEAGPAPPAPPKDPKNPEARFLFGNFGLDLFNPCKRCGFQDALFANSCCLKGKRHCCQYSGGFGGQGFGGQGFGGQGFGGQGFGGPFGGPFGGFGSGPGLGEVGPPGFAPFPGGHNSFFPFAKPGFCPQAGLFGGLGFQRSLGPDEVPLGAADEAKPREKRQGKSLDQGKKAPEARFFNLDSCFSDSDCPGFLKCCMNVWSRRFCTNGVL